MTVLGRYYHEKHLAKWPRVILFRFTGTKLNCPRKRGRNNFYPSWNQSQMPLVEIVFRLGLVGSRLNVEKEINANRKRKREQESAVVSDAPRPRKATLEDLQDPLQNIPRSKKVVLGLKGQNKDTLQKSFGKGQTWTLLPSSITWGPILAFSPRGLCTTCV